MKKLRIVYLVLVALSTYPVAYAQLITSQHGQAQRGATADSGTPIAGMAGIDRAPSTAIGGGLSNNSSAAVQSMESKVDDCESGFTGTKERQRKFYTRADGSVFYEAWYLVKNNCKPVDGPLTPQQVSQVNNMITSNNTNIINQVNQMISQTGKGNWATSVFTIRSGILNQTTDSSSFNTGACVSGFGQQVEAPFDYSEISQGKPYPGWQATSQRFNTYYGPLCPGGSGFVSFSSVTNPRESGE